MDTAPISSEKRAEEVVITALRATTGVILAIHGAMKLMDIPGTIQSFSGLGIPYPYYAAYLAVAGEFFGGLGLLVGLLTRLAALGTLSVMAAAIGFVHFGHGLLAKNGGWEYPLALALISVFFVTHGAGPISLDAWFSRRWHSRRGRSARVASYA